MTVKLTKFPVTTADGTEYRVSITELPACDWYRDCARIKLYTERKRKLFGIFRFKRLATDRMYESDGYNAKDPDYVQAAMWAVFEYEEWIRWKSEYDTKVKRGKSEYGRKQSAAVRKFAEWDGKL